MNYGEMKAAIEAQLQNDEPTFVANHPVAIRQAEYRIYRLAKLPDGNQTTTGSLTGGSNVLPLPAGFLHPRSLRVTASGQTYPVLLKDTSFVHEVAPVAANEARPQFWSVESGTPATGALVAPVPDQGYAYSLDWYGVGSTLVDSGDDDNTSWLGDYGENSLFWWSVFFQYTFMKGSPETLAGYEKIAQEETQLLAAEANQLVRATYHRPR